MVVDTVVNTNRAPALTNLMKMSKSYANQIARLKDKSRAGGKIYFDDRFRYSKLLILL